MSSLTFSRPLALWEADLKLSPVGEEPVLSSAEHCKTNLASATPLVPYLLVDAELERVEQRLSSLLQSREPLLNEIGQYLINAGGKRIRPAVALLVFRACGGQEAADIVDVATALELIHSASLLHDDIIDGGQLRRGKASAFHRFGLADTLVAGDFLFGRAFALCGRFEEKVITWATDACVSLTEGEVMQGRFRHNPQVTTRDYLEIISRKTAALFAQGARMGAHLAGASAAWVRCARVPMLLVDEEITRLLSIADEPAPADLALVHQCRPGPVDHHRADPEPRAGEFERGVDRLLHRHLLQQRDDVDGGALAQDAEVGGREVGQRVEHGRAR